MRKKKVEFQGREGSGAVLSQTFNELISQCVETGLLILGESGRHVVFWKWEQDSGLGKQDITSHLSKFSSFLDEMFGSGGKLVRASIAKEVALKFGLADKEMQDLSSAVQLAREHFTE